MTALIIGFCLCTLVVIYLSCRQDQAEATDEDRLSFFDAHDPARIQRDHTQRVWLNADARQARGCDATDLLLWDEEFADQHGADLETDRSDPRDGGVAP